VFKRGAKAIPHVNLPLRPGEAVATVPNNPGRALQAHGTNRGPRVPPAHLAILTPLFIEGGVRHAATV
jgi:hypothetical protein